jgi:hypothetical protein
MTTSPLETLLAAVEAGIVEILTGGQSCMISGKQYVAADLNKLMVLRETLMGEIQKGISVQSKQPFISTFTFID